ncbi:MAG: hypothetical protein ACI4EK_02095, partial [Wujia sp.]
YEYDEKLHEKTMMEIGREEGLKEGLKKGLQDGRLSTLISQTCRKLSRGKDTHTIADELEEDVDLIDKICQIAEAFAPDYDETAILQELKTTVS